MLHQVSHRLCGRLRPVLLGLLFVGGLVRPQVFALPADFEITEFVGGLKDPATMAFAPDGRLLVGERIAGELRVVSASGQLLATPFLQLDVPPVRHRSGGLRGFAFDPLFPAEPYVYVFYTKQFPGNVRHNRVSRFTVSAGDANVADSASELVLLELPFNATALGSSGSHNGGAVVFGGDGLLYFTTGDGWNASEGYGAGDNVQSLSTFTGKIFRIEKDGTIPTDNPFYTTATGDHRAIYALGFRNPFAATAHPETGEVFVFDVGTAHGGSKDYIYRVSAGANYQHDGGSSGIGTNGTPWAYAGTSIVSGGAWYFSDQFPETYRKRLFVSSWRKGLKTVLSESVNTVADFASADMNDQGPVYPCVGPDGSLYVLASTYETSNGRVYRISYTALNRVETPVISPNGGNFVDQVAVTLSSATPGETIRYTLDGSDPDEASPLYSPPSLTLNSSSTLKARAFATGFDPSAVTSAVFQIEVSTPPAFTNSLPNNTDIGTVYQHNSETTGSPAPVYSLDNAPPGMSINPVTGNIFWLADQPGETTVALRASNGVPPDAVQGVTLNVNNFKPANTHNPATLTQGGLRYSYYEDSSEAASTGISPIPDVSVRLRDDDFRLRFTGYLEVPQDGDYSFSVITASGDSAQILLGGVDVTAATIGLAAGLHRVAVKYEGAIGPESLEIRWNHALINEGAIPSTAFFYDTVAYGVDERRPLPPYLGVFPVNEAGSIPPVLSQTGAFADLVSLTPVDGIVPFTPNSKLWSDGAKKLRWIALPAGDTIGFQATGSWSYPAGTVLIKHFEIGVERRRIETRFEIVEEDGSSYLFTYRWREDQLEADLVPSEGASGTIPFDGGSQEWFFPSRADCVACHNSSVRHVLGLSTRQLNGDLSYPSGISDNQLRTWIHLGMLNDEPTEGALDSLDRLSEITDSSATLEHRVRSYFDSNCSFCHNSAAAPEGTDFVLEFDTPLAETGVINGVAVNELGFGSVARVIAPRDPRHSMLYQRLAGNDPANRMPPLGRNIVHGAARETLVEWILSLPPANTVVDVNDYSRRWTFDGDLGTGSWRDTVNPPIYEVGKIGQALTFDGADDAVDLGPLDAADGSALTITLWFKADDFGTSDARFLSKADGDQDQDHYWMLSTLNGSQLRLRLKAGGTTTTLISNSGVLSTGVWTHVAARYDGATMKLFKDGNEVASTAKTGVLDTNGTVDAAIGNQPTTAVGGSRPFDGLIDDVRIYPRALSSAEIVMVHDSGGLPNSAPVVSIPPPSGAVGTGNFLTRADAATNLTASATDTEDGEMSGSVTWLSTTAGDVNPASLPDGAHTLVATARDANGSADSALMNVFIVPGFGGWAADHGVAPSPSLDPGKDGLTFLQEYAFGMAPDSGSGVSPVKTSLGTQAGVIELRFPADPRAIDIRYGAEFGVSPDAFAPGPIWTPMGNTIIGGQEDSVIEMPGGAFEIEASSDSDSAPRKFGRTSVKLE